MTVPASPTPEDAPDNLSEIPSPCIGVCELDEESGRCTGCLRTLAEIGAWREAGGTERLAIMARLKERRREMGITSPADSRPRRRRARLAGSTP